MCALGAGDKYRVWGIGAEDRMDRLGVILLDLVSTRPSPSNGQTAKSLLASTSPQAAASEPPPGETLGTHTHSRLRGGGYGPHAALPQAQCSLPSISSPQPVCLPQAARCAAPGAREIRLDLIRLPQAITREFLTKTSTTFYLRAPLRSRCNPAMCHARTSMRLTAGISSRRRLLWSPCLFRMTRRFCGSGS